MSQSDLIFHVAIDHKLIEKFIKELTIELKKFGSGFNIPSLICPYNQYETCSKEKTPFQLIQHLVDHCNAEVYMIKSIYSEKATKFCEISALLLSYVVPVKSKVKSVWKRMSLYR